MVIERKVYKGGGWAWTDLFAIWLDRAQHRGVVVDGDSRRVGFVIATWFWAVATGIRGVRHALCLEVLDEFAGGHFSWNKKVLEDGEECEHASEGSIYGFEVPKGSNTDCEAFGDAE
jgi:hypothetical protein